MQALNFSVNIIGIWLFKKYVWCIYIWDVLDTCQVPLIYYLLLEHICHCFIVLLYFSLFLIV